MRFTVVYDACVLYPAPLPDPEDRHVLAAAIRSGAQAIITFNQRDFPAEELEQYDVVTLHPDEFVVRQLDLAGSAVAAVARKHRAALKNPSKTVENYLETLATQGLVVTADRLAEFEALI